MPQQHYEALKLDSIPGTEHYVCVTAGGNERVLDGLGGVNLFVGPNSAGKSRLLRALYRSTNLVFRPSGFDAQELAKRVERLNTEVRERLSHNILKYGPVSGPEHFARFSNLDWLSEHQPEVGALLRELQALRESGDFNPTFNGTYGVPTPDMVKSLHNAILVAARPVEQFASAIAPAVGGEQRTYIPVLRGLRPLTASGARGDLYAERTTGDYKLALPNAATGEARSPSVRHEVFTGQTLYDDLRDLLLGTRDQRQLVEAYQHFLAEHLFEGREVELTPRKDSDVVHFRIDGDEERPIYMLGDGIQSLIIMTFPAFVAASRSLMFIEEPDTFLHPGMQRKVLELFLRHERLLRHQVFVTTHSNHLLDMAADYPGCTTYLFRKEIQANKPSFTIRTVRQSDRFVLDELGVRASSVFLTNATIWVEGITDRLYLREYLAKFLGEQGLSGLLREDTHFSFMEGGGANVAHFSFDSPSAVDELTEQIKVARVCTNSFVVLDGDNEGKPRVEPLKKALGDRLYILKSKEVENLLPLEVLLVHVRKAAGARGVNESLIKLEHYHRKNTPLGKVLDQKFKTQDLFTERKSIKRKASVCETCVAFMRAQPNAWSLTPEARTVCDALVRFIAEANGIDLAKLKRISP